MKCKGIKIIALLLILCLCLGVVVVFTIDPNKNGNLQYETINNGTEYMLVSWNSMNVEETEIPAKHKRKPVTSIDKFAFSNQSIVKVIKISEGVKTIGDNAFIFCVNLERIELPNSLTNLGDTLFCNCNSFKTIIYNGKIEEWNNISKSTNWYGDVNVVDIVCLDGKIKFDRNQ